MTKYEIMYILNPSAEIEILKKKIEDIITFKNGKIIETKDWGIRDLAYPINKQKKGHYSVIICETTIENIDELLHLRKIDSKRLIRLLIINTEKEKHYVQSVELSKTEITQEKIEYKTIGKKYERKTFNLNKSDNKNEINNINKQPKEQIEIINNNKIEK